MPISKTDAIGVIESQKLSKAQDVGVIQSALAGVVTGVINIPKGFISLGAEIVDLGLDTNTAASVEQFFDDQNPFDEMAEARTIGRITQALTQIGIPAFKGAEIGRNLARKALKAKADGKYANVGRFGKIINKFQTSEVAGTIAGAAAGEAIVSDEEIGTLGDMLKGTSLEPFALTMMNTDQKEGREEAFRRLTNRVKFAIDGSLFNLGIFGAAKGINAIRKTPEFGAPKYAESPLGLLYQKYVKFGLGKAGFLPEEIFENQRLGLDASKAIEIDAGNKIEKLFDAVQEVVPAIENNIFKNEDVIYKEIMKIIQPLPGKKDLLSGKEFIAKMEKESGIVNLSRDKLKFEFTDDGFRKLVREEGSGDLFRTTDELGEMLAEQKTKDGTIVGDYLITKGGRMDLFLKKIKDSSNEKVVNKFKNILLGMRSGLDNMSTRVLDLNLQKELSLDIEKGIGNYLTADYAAFQKNAFPFFRTAQANARKEEALNYLVDKRIREEAAGKGVRPEDIKQDGEFMRKVREEESKIIEKKLKARSLSEVDAGIKDPQKSYTGDTKLNKIEEETLKINPSILQEKKLDELGEILYGRITDPKHAYISSMTKMATLVHTLEFMDYVAKSGSKARASKTGSSDALVRESKFVFGKVNRIEEDEAIREILGKTGAEELTEIDIKAGKKLLNKTQYNKIEEYRAAKELVENGDAADLEDAVNMLRDPKQFKKVEPVSKDVKLLGLSPLEGAYVRAPIYDDIVQTALRFDGGGNIASVYRYGVLAPKAVAQITKTILSPITHVRNFISASSFALANGAALPAGGDYSALLPVSLGGDVFKTAGLDKGLFETARRITVGRVTGKLDPKEINFTKRLIRVGMLDSQVQQGEMEALQRLDLGITDWFVKPEKAQGEIYNSLLTGIKKGKRLYGKAVDAYVGEDNYWKTITWGLERNRYEKIFKDRNITSSNFQNILRGEAVEGVPKELADYIKQGIKRNFDPTTGSYLGNYEEFLDEFAANLGRNLVPNYSYVGRAGKALRLSPFGNFIAFPLEIIRTGSNIIEQAIKERNSGIKAIEALGNKRLLSFGITVGGIPKVTQETFKAIHNVSDEEMDALRRVVPAWSKNSTLLPTGRDKNGYLKYIDFSYSTAYDVLLRPFQTVFNSITDGKTDEASLKQSLGEGLQEGVVELLKPFTEESIFTEALVDVAIRQGVRRDGSRIWSTSDDPFIKIFKGISNLAESFEPGSYQQLKRLGITLTGQSDKYGEQFNLFDELPGLAGFRTQSSNPERSLVFKTTSFIRNLKRDENLFSSPLLRGGRITPEQIVNGYKYSESRRFQTFKEMAKDIDAMRKLNMPEFKIEQTLKNRKGVSKDNIESLLRSSYKPKEISKFFEERTGEINRKLNSQENKLIPNPLIQALPQIRDIQSSIRGVNLLTEEFKFKDLQTELLENISSTEIQTPPLGSTPAPNPDIIQTQTPLTSEQTIDRIRAFGGR